MVYTGLSALVGQSICLCPSICLSIIPYQLSVLYESVYTSPSIDRVSVCISISSVCYTSLGHSLFFFVSIFTAPFFAPSPFYVSFVILIAVIVVLFIVIFVSYCLFASFFFYFPPFSTICLSVGFSVFVPLHAHILHYIHPKFVAASNFSKFGALHANG